MRSALRLFDFCNVGFFVTVQALILKYAAASRKADGKEKMKPAAEHTFSYVSRGLESSTSLAALSAAALTSWIVTFFSSNQVKGGLH